MRCYAVSKLKVKVQNVDKVIKNIDKYNDEIQDKIKQVLANGGMQIQNEAQRCAPVRTGTLRASIECKLDGLQVEVIAGTNYASFVEFGTRFMEAQPYLTPAFELVAPQIERNVREVLKDAK